MADKIEVSFYSLPPKARDLDAYHRAALHADEEDEQEEEVAAKVVRPKPQPKPKATENVETK